jgi:hypothetical protein
LGFGDAADNDGSGKAPSVATIDVTPPQGLISAMAVVSIEGRTLRLDGLHMQGGLTNLLGHANLMVLAQVLLER